MFFYKYFQNINLSEHMSHEIYCVNWLNYIVWTLLLLLIKLSKHFTSTLFLLVNCSEILLLRSLPHGHTEPR